MDDYVVLNGNEAVARMAYLLNDIAIIYPITPSSEMGELCDYWSSKEKKNLFGEPLKVVEMQSEGGVAGALHGALVSGALTTTFTSSQGLLLMIPNMYKISGELLPTVFHVASRSVATSALSIFGDHSDVMAVRQTGFALLASNSVQEAMDMALIASLATLESSVPFLHFFEGFRTSHEIQKVKNISFETVKSLLNQEYIEKFRKKKMDPKNPTIRGTTQNPDICFQSREAVNKYYEKTPEIVQNVMDRFGEKVGRKYRLFDYVGLQDAESVVIAMGSACDTIEEFIKSQNSSKIGLIKVYLYRPFSKAHLLQALPNSVKRIAVLDRTKEPGSLGEPLYLDIVAALQRKNISIIHGRYGISSKEFTPIMVKTIYDNLESSNPKEIFSVGINDDVTNLSLPLEVDCADEKDFACLFYGLGSDGTVGANKNTIKIIGEKTDLFTQGYFVYDSKKSGGITVSHLRFGKEPIKARYLVTHADFIACHNENYLGHFGMLNNIKEGGTFLLNSTYGDDVFHKLPLEMQKIIIDKKIKFFNINAYKIAAEAKLGFYINIIMQAAFFYISNILKDIDSIGLIKESIEASYAHKGKDLVEQNFFAVDQTIKEIKEIKVPQNVSAEDVSSYIYDDEFYKDLIQPIQELVGDYIPVSKLPADGVFKTGTTKYDKNYVGLDVPSWLSKKCIQCNQCAFVCPHAAIRAKQIDPKYLDGKPETFEVIDSDSEKALKYRIQIYPQHCTSCGLCVKTCPVNCLEMKRRADEKENVKFFDSLPENNVSGAKEGTLKWSQFKQPLFEFSGACAGCGQTPYIKLLTQLFGEKMVIANATGCSSIYGGTVPNFPYSKNQKGEGPSWANSLFEDNAEFGYGMKLAIDQISKNGKKSSVWIIGGDGWAYDIGYGGLDHIIASGADVNILVLDTEVYSNTGGQASKATNLGAIAKFAYKGKQLPKKDLGLMAMSYGYVYVASVNLGANKQQLINAFLEAESYKGPSIIIAYCPCVSHGFNLSQSLEHAKQATLSGYWPIYRYNPLAKKKFVLDSDKISFNLREFLNSERRYSSLGIVNKNSEEILIKIQDFIKKRFDYFSNLNSETFLDSNWDKNLQSSSNSL